MNTYTPVIHESEVRCYCRDYPARFKNASGPFMYDVRGARYIDFLSGCGSLNYGHNEPRLKEALQKYISSNGLTLGLDLDTTAKFEFINEFEQCILRPRGYNYRLQFTGPTGTNAVEAAIKLARKVTRRTNVITFTNAFHGCTLGALALSGSRHHRSSSIALLSGACRIPYDGYFGDTIDTADMLERMLFDKSSGIDLPAAVILEVVQGEGGLNVATTGWLKKVETLCRQIEALLIIDDIQTGSGRTGPFFAFETAGLNPDIVALAKSLSGFGLPMSLTLLKPYLDQWKPGEHNGTFRGNNHAFVTAVEAFRCFWKDGQFQSETKRKSHWLEAELGPIAAKYNINVKGKGMMVGLQFADSGIASMVKSECFENGLIVECCGPNAETVKLLPPLNIDDQILKEGVEILSKSIETQYCGG